MKQTGLLTVFSPTDYRTGASPLIPVIVNETGDWSDFRPEDERQSKEFHFDTMSCTTFSALNICETTINYFIAKGTLDAEHIKWLNDNGYMKNGKVNFSDRFTAIMSGTTPQGNYMQKVWDSIRNDGLLPESELPFGGNNWAEYHNARLITQAMKDKARKICDIFQTNYEWPANGTAGLPDLLKECPLHVAIFNKSHAVELINKDHRFDTYDPFYIKMDTPVDYALKGFIRPKSIVPRILKKGMKGDDVKKLQTDLASLGYMVGLIDGDFGNKTQTALVAFQTRNGLKPDGIAGAQTFAKIAELKKKLNISKAGLDLLKQFEGCVLKPYKDSFGYWTIGYGNRFIHGTGVSASTRPITQAEAEQLLIDSLQEYQQAIRELVTIPLTQNQFDALCSLIFNIGIGAFKTSRLLKNLNAGKITRQDFLRFVKGTNQETGVFETLPGLVNRRNKEATYFGCA